MAISGFDSNRRLTWAIFSSGWTCPWHFQPKLGSPHVLSSCPLGVGGLVCLWPILGQQSLKEKKINKKREKIKRRCRILHNPPVALFAAASVLYSANESHQRASSSPTTHVLSSEETRAARCLFTFFFQPDSVQTSHNKSTGSPKLLLSTCSTQTSSHSDVHDCRFLLLVPNRERKPD